MTWVNLLKVQVLKEDLKNSISKTVYQNLVNLTNLLINLAVKARAKKME